MRRNDVYRHKRHVVVCRVEFDYVEMLLQERKPDSEHIAQDYCLDDKFVSQEDEYALNCEVCCAHCLELAYHADALQDDCQHGGNERECRHNCHDYKDNNHIHVKQLQPNEVAEVVAVGVGDVINGGNVFVLVRIHCQCREDIRR